MDRLTRRECIDSFQAVCDTPAKQLTLEQVALLPLVRKILASLVADAALDESGVDVTVPSAEILSAAKFIPSKENLS